MHGLANLAGAGFERCTEQLRVTAVPAVQGPGLVDRLLPQVMGSVVELEQAGTVTLRLYITGDTLYREQLGEIRRRFPDIDVMIAHLGGTRIMEILLTMDGRRGTDLVCLVQPRMTVPVQHRRLHGVPLAAVRLLRGAGAA